MEINFEKKIIDNIQIDGIDYKDYPDFCDAHITSADYNGVPMTEEELEILNEDSEFVYDAVISQIF